MGNWKAAVAIQFYGGNLEVRVPAGIIERRQLLNTSLFRRHNFCSAHECTEFRFESYTAVAVSTRLVSHAEMVGSAAFVFFG